MFAWNGAASGSQLFVRDVTAVKLAVNASGKALLTYERKGVTRHMLVSGAVNALPPSQTTPQVRFDMTEVADPGNYDQNDLAKVERQSNGLSLLKIWNAPPA